MGFFRDVGRRVERFKSEVETVADDQAPFECTACGKRLHTDHDSCPDCGADAVERRVQDTDSTAEDPSQSTAASGDDTDEPPADETAD